MNRRLHRIILIRPAVMLMLLLVLAALIVMGAEPGRTSAYMQQSGTATPAEESDATATPSEESEATPAPDEEAATPMPTEEATAASTEEPAEEATPEPAAEEADDSAYAAELWQRLQEEGYTENWSTVPGKGELYPGQPPHGALLTTYLNDSALEALEAQPGAMPDGSVIIKENYRPDETLVSVTVMEKRADFAPAYNDWYYARYGPDGSVQGGGQMESCMVCHAAVRSNDYIFTFVVAPVDDLSTLASATPAEESDASESAEVARETTPTPTPEPLSEDELISMGEEEFSEYCAACHQADGQGIPNAYPPLAGNGFVLAEDPTGVLRVIFTGRAGMPHFHNALSNQEIAAIISYVRNSWGNEASAVSAEEVRAVEEEIYSPAEAMEHNGNSE